MATRSNEARVLSFCVAVALFGCGEPRVDAKAPPPTGVLDGSLVYIGPRPVCDYDQSTGLPTRARGRVVLFLFGFGNPPPPEGTATAPANLLSVPASQFFADLEEDCLPGVPSPEDLADVVQRVAAFTWPEIALGRDGEPASYMIQGYVDRDEDFNPFFAITVSPTAGDIAGGAFEDPFAAEPVLDAITFGSADAHPAGEVVEGVTVTFAATVNTEPPIFRFQSAPLSSEQPFAVTVDPAANEELFRQITDASIVLYDDTTTPEGSSLLEALAAGGLSFALDDPSYAIYVRALDFDRDGAADPHPVLGAAAAGGYPWLSPVVLVRRIKSDLEARAALPDVAFVPALPNFTSAEGSPVTAGQIFTTSVPLVIPPAVAIITNPDVPVCQVAGFAPGAPTEVYFDALADCQELPTGRYSVSVVHGVVGGTFVASLTSPSGFDLVGGELSGQVWTIPNELGDPVELPPLDAPPGATPEPDCTGDARCTDSQGIATAFLVHDPDTATSPSRANGDATCLFGPSVFAPTATEPYVFTDFATSAVQALVDADPALDTVEQVRALCCDPIAHLCGLPLCGYVPAQGDPTRSVRGGPSALTRVVWTDGTERFVPDCVPFFMPTPCCG